MDEDQDRRRDDREAGLASPLIAKGGRGHISDPGVGSWESTATKRRLERQADEILAEVDGIGYSEAAAKLGREVRTLKRWVRQGRLKAHHVTPAGRYVFRPEDLDAAEAPSRGRPAGGRRRQTTAEPTERVLDAGRPLSEHTLDRKARLSGSDSYDEMEERAAARGEGANPVGRQLYRDWLTALAESEYWDSVSSSTDYGELGWDDQDEEDPDDEAA